LVNRASRRICILIVTFWRSTCEVLTFLLSGLPKMGTFLHPMHPGDLASGAIGATLHQVLQNTHGLFLGQDHIAG
jgi:hypothetical protein